MVLSAVNSCLIPLKLGGSCHELLAFHSHCSRLTKRVAFARCRYHTSPVTMHHYHTGRWSLTSKWVIFVQAKHRCWPWPVVISWCTKDQSTPASQRLALDSSGHFPSFFPYTSTNAAKHEICGPLRLQHCGHLVLVMVVGHACQAWASDQVTKTSFWNWSKHPKVTASHLGVAHQNQRF